LVAIAGRVGSVIAKSSFLTVYLFQSDGAGAILAGCAGASMLASHKVQNKNKIFIMLIGCLQAIFYE